MPKGYDFEGWATKNNLRCADGLTIRKDAFKVNDGKKVPLVWSHVHDKTSAVLGHAILENKEEGVYAYGYFNDTQSGKEAKECVKHGDVECMSIWANNLEQMGKDVMHGVIREVSLVLAGANPGAMIESVLAHSVSIDEEEDECLIHTGLPISFISHSEEEDKKEDDSKSKEKDSEDGKTVEDVFNTLTEDQKKAVAVIVGQAIADSQNGEESPKKDEEEKEMRHNIFDTDLADQRTHISHDDMKNLLSEAKRLGSLKAAVDENIKSGGFLAHAFDTTGMTPATGEQTYGFNDPSMLFPDYKTLNTTPEWLSRNMDWVSKVMNGVHHTPFSRIKSVYADITEDEARAKGYIKGKQKKEEVFTTLKRTTDPQTVYKKQKMDRDDIVDITDFNVIEWIKAEMRIMLNEEIARAILIGDGRPSDSDDKIKEQHVRPIVSDVPLFNTKVVVEATSTSDPGVVAKDTINTIIRARKNYKGSGNPTFFTTEDVVTEMLLLEDGVGHKLYKTEAELATTLRVKEIVTVEPMEGYTLDTDTLIGVIVNLGDYNVGADKGGEINLFDDFDIDYNQYKYLIETRISGALIKPFSALTVVRRNSDALSLANSRSNTKVTKSAEE